MSTTTGLCGRCNQIVPMRREAPDGFDERTSGLVFVAHEREDKRGPVTNVASCPGGGRNEYSTRHGY